MSATYEDVLNLFRENNLQIRELVRLHQETERHFQETERRFQETERHFQETERRFQETERHFQETERRFQETERHFQETERLLKESSQETERRFQETERLLKESSQETDRQFRETNNKLNQLEKLFTTQWGKLIESLVEGDLVNILRGRGILIADTTTRLKGICPDGGSYEFDILAHNGDELVVVEVKTTLRPKDVLHFIAKLNRLKTWIPRYAHNHIYGAMAWLTADAGAEQMVIKRGLFGIRATGNSAFMQNPIDFVPRQW